MKQNYAVFVRGLDASAAIVSGIAKRLAAAGLRCYVPDVHRPDFDEYLANAERLRAGLNPKNSDAFDLAVYLGRHWRILEVKSTYAAFGDVASVPFDPLFTVEASRPSRYPAMDVLVVSTARRQASAPPNLSPVVVAPVSSMAEWRLVKGVKDSRKAAPPYDCWACPKTALLDWGEYVDILKQETLRA